MIKFSDLLKEIGDTAGYYRYRNTEDMFKVIGKDEAQILYMYEFETENFDYEVTLEKSGWNKVVAIRFQIGWEQAADLGTGVYNAVTNEGNIFKIVGTIVSIVKDFHKKMEKEERFPRFYKGYEFSGTEKEGVDTNQRNRLYIKFIETQFPNAEIRIRKNNVTVLPEGQ